MSAAGAEEPTKQLHLVGRGSWPVSRRLGGQRAKSNSELRAVAEVDAASDGREKSVRDFVKALTKGMTLDRVDLQRAWSEARLASNKPVDMREGRSSVAA